MTVMLKGDIAGFLFEASMLFFKQHDGFFPEYQLMIMFWLLNHNENPLIFSLNVQFDLAFLGRKKLFWNSYINQDNKATKNASGTLELNY